MGEEVSYVVHELVDVEGCYYCTALRCCIIFMVTLLEITGIKGGNLVSRKVFLGLVELVIIRIGETVNHGR